MKDEEICVGDVLRVRDWEDMKNEYKIDLDGDLWIPFKDHEEASGIWFVSCMKYMCGQIFTIREKKDHGSYFTYCSEERLEGKRGDSYIIVSDMLEPFNEPYFEVATDDEISVLLGKAG